MYSTARTGRPTTAGNGPAATRQARVAIDREGDANQGSNLMAADSPEFGQFSEKRSVRSYRRCK